MTMSRRGFVSGTLALAVAPLLAADGSKYKTPFLLDAKRMAIYDGPGVRTTFFVEAKVAGTCGRVRLVGLAGRCNA